MHRQISAFACLCFTSLAVAALPAAEPIVINTFPELQEVGRTPSRPLSGDYVLGRDIDGYSYRNGNSVWYPIGTEAAPFTGSFDGRGFTIYDLTLTDTNWMYGSVLPGAVGLFGFTGPEARITGVTLANARVFWADRAGGVVGHNRGTITDCSVTGQIVASGAQAGGIAGYSEGTISGCRSAARVAAMDEAGGIAGRQAGTVTNCFALGAVAAAQVAGGLVGRDDSTGGVSYSFAAAKVSSRSGAGGGLIGAAAVPSALACYWDAATSGQATSAGGLSRTADDLLFPFGPDTYVGWDFEAAWEGGAATASNNGYPVPRGAAGPVELRYTAGQNGQISGEAVQSPSRTADGSTVTAVPAEGYDFIKWSDGVMDSSRTDLDVARNLSVTAEFGHLIPIATFADLDAIRSNPSGNYVQTADIDASVTEGSNSGLGWRPIPAFTGTFDGRGFRIDHLTSRRAGELDSGLFASLEPGSVVRRVALTDVYMEGVCVGGIAGTVTYSYGFDPAQVSESFVTGWISGRPAGGLFGRDGDARVSRCYSNATIKEDGGGFAGGSDVGAYNNCFALGDAQQGSFAYRSEVGLFLNCFAAPAVPRTTYPHLAALMVNMGTYYTWESTPPEWLARGLPRTRVEMTEPYAANTYMGWDFEHVWQAGPENNGLPYHRWQTKRHRLNYMAGTNGRIEGEALQSRIPGADGAAVTAVPADGFGFVRWSDGSRQNPRIDTAVTSDLSVTAEFDRFVTIATFADLEKVRANPAGHFVQTADIDASVTAQSSYNSGRGWKPIEGFSGTYHGRGHRIAHLACLPGSGGSAALFSSLAEEGYLVGMGLTDVRMDGYVAAALVDYCQGQVEDCYATGEVTAGAYAGGLIGHLFFAGSVSKCYASAKVAGEELAGGLIGIQYGASVTDSYSRGVVSSGGEWGPGKAAGLICDVTAGDLLDCYATSSVVGGGQLGGLVATSELLGVRGGNYWLRTEGGVTVSSEGEPFWEPEPDRFILWAAMGHGPQWADDELPKVNNGFPYHRWQTRRHTLRYTAGLPGRLSGETTQVRIPGADGTPVTAVAPAGSSFLRWSDGSTDNPRQDLQVSDDLNVTAIFAVNGDWKDTWVVF